VTESPAYRETGHVAVAADVSLAWRRTARDGAPLVVPAWSWLGDDLAPLESRFSYLTYDLRGRGRSSAVLDDARLGFEQDLADLETVREALAIERMRLLGWSYYGALAARYALAHPARVERLVLIAPSGPAQRPFFSRFLERFAERIDPAGLSRLETARRAGLKESDPLAWCRAVNRLFFEAYVADPRSLDAMRSSPCAAPNLDIDRVNNQGRKAHERLGDYDWRGDFGALRVPTLILHGLEDPVLVEGSHEWARILPDARLVLWDATGHMPWLERPELFFPAVERFLAGKEP
jgi:proline iminopeptidase